MCEVLDVHGYLVGDLIHIFCNLVPDFVLLGAVTLLKYIFLLALIWVKITFTSTPEKLYRSCFMEFCGYHQMQIRCVPHTSDLHLVTFL